MNLREILTINGRIALTKKAEANTLMPPFLIV